MRKETVMEKDWTTRDGESTGPTPKPKHRGRSVDPLAHAAAREPRAPEPEETDMPRDTKTKSKKATRAAKVETVQRPQLEELLLQSLETELGGVQVYETAIECAVNDDLREEWSEYLEQTRNHVEVLHRVFDVFDLDAEKESEGRSAVAGLGKALVQAMESARDAGDAEAAQLVAAECVVLAETKDHQNWSLLSLVATKLDGDERRVLEDAVSEVEDEEDEHLYHTAGWARELWIDGLGLPAALPPPEEKRDVRTAISAARARQQRESNL
jgi:ferritin-like metal-binding protein YciE